MTRAVRSALCPFLLLALLAILPAPALAGGPAAPGQSRPDPAEVQSPLLPTETEVSYQAAYMHYREPGLMKETGILNGAHLQFTLHTPSQLMFRAEGDLLAGGLKYRGHYQNGQSVGADTDDFLGELKLVAGGDILFKDWVLTPYIGLGGRDWQDKIKSSGGYRREVIYAYIPMGAEATFELEQKWRATLRAEFDLLAQGWVTSRLSDVSAAYDDVHNRQNFGTGYGSTISASLKRTCGVGWGVFLEPWFKSWYVKESSKDKGFVEPQNESYLGGVRLGVDF